MHQIPSDIKKRLLTVLHLGCVEIRNLCYAERCEQAAYLADILEFLPQFVENCTAEDLETILEQLEGYETKYPDRSSPLNYSKALDPEQPVPDFWTSHA